MTAPLSMSRRRRPPAGGPSDAVWAAFSFAAVLGVIGPGMIGCAAPILPGGGRDLPSEERDAARGPLDISAPADRGAAFQALFGLTLLDDETARVDLPSSGAAQARLDLSPIPTLGFAGQMPMAEQSLFGVEGSMLMGVRLADVDAFAFDSRTLRVDLDQKLALIDLAAGPYVATVLGEKLRAYAAAGPLVMLGVLEIDIDQDLADGTHEEQRENDLGLALGGYARAGIDWRITRQSFIGVGARVTRVSLDFTDFGRIDMGGLQIFLELTHTF